MINSIVKIELNDKLFSNWKSFSAEFDMEEISSSFSLEIFDKDFLLYEEFKVGLNCTIFVSDSINGELIKIIEGYITRLNLNISGDNTSFSIEGSDSLIDLVECSVKHENKAWANSKFTSILSDLLGPFNIELDRSQLTEDKIIPRFTLQSGESVFSAIERLCRNQAILPLSTFDSKLLLTNSDFTFFMPLSLEMGKNILSFTESVDYSDRFSDYTGLGQYSGNGKKWTKSNLSGKATAQDLDMPRYRPFVVIAETKIERQTLSKRINWESQVRAGRSKEYQITVTDWFQRDENGNSLALWEKNKLVRLRVADLNIDSDLLITKVTFLQSESGTFTELTLKDPIIFMQNPSEQTSLT